jgi:crotonobetainyl-CoA:carnitine CoA-transferase CaiB-like acyl-CoA transferase
MQRDLHVVGQSMQMSRTPSSIRMAAPDAGEHTEEVLTALGVSEADVASLRARKVV